MESKLRTYQGATAVVTGAASGIGRALTEELVARGCHVIAADIELEGVKEIAEGLSTREPGATAVQLDVTDPEAFMRVVRGAADQRGRIDYIFNNAGIGAGGTIYDHTLEAWNRVIAVNLNGVVHGVRAAYPIMREQGFGHIVNTASMAGLVATAMGGAYAATKHAVVGLSKTLRAEAVADGIRVSAFCPGVIRTPLLLGGKHGVYLENEDTRGVSEDEVRSTMRDAFERKTRPMDVGVFAKKALDQVARNRPIIVVPGWWKGLWWLERLSPSLGLLVAEKVSERMKVDLSREMAVLRERNAG
jgi:NAD(P)-dependent dehydrogenase (short-subunit alcohol dehydrogenase family)